MISQKTQHIPSNTKKGEIRIEPTKMIDSRNGDSSKTLQKFTNLRVTNERWRFVCAESLGCCNATYLYPKGSHVINHGWEIPSKSWSSVRLENHHIDWHVRPTKPSFMTEGIFRIAGRSSVSTIKIIYEKSCTYVYRKHVAHSNCIRFCYWINWQLANMFIWRWLARFYYKEVRNIRVVSKLVAPNVPWIIVVFEIQNVLWMPTISCRWLCPYYPRVVFPLYTIIEIPLRLCLSIKCEVYIFTVVHICSFYRVITLQYRQYHLV